MENSQSKDDKEDNSYAKRFKEEEKGDTLMHFKQKDKAQENDEYVNTDPNNQDSQNNYNSSNLKANNKIKLNSALLKQSKINVEKELMEENKEKNNNGEKNDEIISMPQTFRGIGENIFTNVNRCCSDRYIMIITIIMVLYSILLFLFGLFDFIKKIQNKTKNNYFMNTMLFLIFDIINITSILIYHIMNYFLKTKSSHNFIILFICILVIVSIIRCLNYVKKSVNIFAILINLCQNIFAILINGLTLYFFFIDAKKRKSDMNGIQEIINFSEMNANIKTKKEDGLQLDIVGMSKEKPKSLVEEEVDSNINNNNNEIN